VNIAVLSLAVSLTAPLAAAAPHGYWIQAVPEGAAEAALQQVVRDSAGTRPDVATTAFARISDAHPGTAASGLARLAAGLYLLDQNRAADAQTQLRHPDIAHTALADYAALAVARALEADKPGAAGEAYAALLDRDPATPLTCVALIRGGEAFERAQRPDKALPLLDRALSSCSGQEPRVLLLKGRCHEQRREYREAAVAFDRVDHDYPASGEANEAGARLRTVAKFLPLEAADVKAARDLKKALTLFDRNRPGTAAPLFRRLLAQRAPADQLDLIRVRLGRCLYEQEHWREAEAQLKGVPGTSPLAAEAAYYVARIDARRRKRIAGYEEVATKYPGSPWAEESLMALANFNLKDALHDAAVPYLRRLLAEYPEGKHGERAAWWVGLADFRAQKYASAAQIMETAARRPGTNLNSGFLYWAGRARIAAGEVERGRSLLQETVRRFKHTYHGLRAIEALKPLPPTSSAAPPTLRAARPDPSAEVPPARLVRLRQLLLLDRLEEAMDELKLQPATSATQATIAWIHSRRGRLRPAIIAMKRAYPEHVGEGADQLPDEVLRIMYPLEFRTQLEARAKSRGLDPAIVAALVCQESTFDPGALSSAGARGLMQIIPVTGRALARAVGVRFRAQSLHNPEVSLEYGTRYLRQMTDEFGGRVERALAAYNAGPHRVDAWTATRPDVSAEEFVETIPFTETRGYVMIILANAERYRKIYSM
jgi:soluble lytic murein transglycosylase